MPGKIDKLVFHIGDPKTGSTSIQRTLYDNRWSATDTTIVTPKSLATRPIAQALAADMRSQATSEQFSQLAHWLSEQEADIAVISSEHFASVRPEDLKEAISCYLPDFETRVQVIAFVRPHASRLLSSYIQTVKTKGRSISFERYCRKMIRRKRRLYSPRFSSWRDSFGKAFVLRPMVTDHLYRGDVVADFFYQILGSEKFDLASAKRFNTSPTLNQLSLLLEFHNTLRATQIPDRVRTGFAREFAKFLSICVRDERERMKIPQDIFNKLQQAFSQDAAFLDSEFFSGSPMSTALQEAGRNTADKPQTIILDERFNSQTVDVIRKVLADLVHTIDSDIVAWRRYLSKTSQINYVDREPLSGTPVPIDSMLNGLVQVLNNK